MSFLVYELAWGGVLRLVGVTRVCFFVFCWIWILLGRYCCLVMLVLLCYFSFGDALVDVIVYLYVVLCVLFVLVDADVLAFMVL